MTKPKKKWKIKMKNKKKRTENLSKREISLYFDV